MQILCCLNYGQGKTFTLSPKSRIKYGEIKVLLREKHVQMKDKSLAFEYFDNHSCVISICFEFLTQEN